MSSRLPRFLPLLALAVGCHRDAPSPPRTQPATTASAAGSSADGDAQAPGDGGGRVELASNLPWPEAIRRDQWASARDSIAALPPAEQGKPEVRFARAKVAIATGRHAEAVSLLEKLEDDLPLLRDAIAKARAEATLVAGPFEKAAEWYGARPGVASWLIAAQAWDKAADVTRARASCDRVLADPKRSRAQEEKARTLRMRLVREKDGPLAAEADARWLAVHATSDDAAKAGSELLAGLTPARTLGSEDLLERARVLAETLRTEEAFRLVERAGSTPGKATPVDLCRARAETFYKARTRYAEAALAYRSCAALGGPHAAEDLFLSARAFSRADRDGDAIPAFQAVAQRHPKTVWADQADFHVARTHSLAGRWREAARAFDDYAKQWPAGKERREAARYRALAHLMAGEHKTARKLLEDLAGSGEDPIASARWTNLAAVAALRDGDRLHAVSRWSEVARSRPLSWPALVARAHLTAQGAPIPVTIDPQESGEAPDPLAVELPPPADLLHRIGLDADAEEALHEREGVVSGKAQGRGTEALCAAYAMVDRGKRRNALSLAVPSPLLATAPGPKNRWAWDCAFPRPHRSVVHDEAARAKIDPGLVWAVMRQESGFDPDVVSPARAVGLMQLLPETAKAVASAANLEHEDARLTSPATNIRLGSMYLQELAARFGGNTTLAVAAYNAGPEAILRWQARAKNVPLDVFVESIPFVETRGYVVRVMGNLSRYGFFERGEAGVPRLSLDMH